MEDKMYPYQGEARYPVDFGPGHGPLPAEPPSGMARYGYPGYYPPKGPESSQFGPSSAPQLGPQQLGGKPGAMVGQEGMYGPGWASGAPGQGYLAAPGSNKTMTKQDYPFPGQPDIYARMPPSQGLPESIPHPGLSGYQPAPGYGPSPQYPGQYPYRSSRPIHLHHGVSPGVMGGGGMPDGFMDGRGQPMGGAGMEYMSGGGSWSADPSRRVMVQSTRGAPWNQDMPPGQWASYASPSRDNFPSEGPSTPRQSSHSSQQPQPGGGAQIYRQPSTQSLTAMSPQPSFSGELQKQPSVSSLRDALLTSTPSSTSQSQQLSQQPQGQQFAYSPRIGPDANSQPSPLTPSTNLPPTPDASTPMAANTAVLSPSLPQKPAAFSERQDSQLSTDSLSSLPRRHNSDMGMMGSGSPLAEPTGQVDPLVENILGIKNDKPVDGVASNSLQLQQQGSAVGFNSLHSRVATPGGEGGVMHSPVGSRDGGAFPEDLLKDLPHERANNAVDSLSERRDSVVEEDVGSPTVESMKMAKAKKASVMSPIDRNHPSIVSQYNYSSEEERREFLDALFAHLEKEGIPLQSVPAICKAPLDLYRTYSSVQQLGGFVNVTEKQLWREVLKSFNSTAANPNSGALRTLQQCYVKLLLPYECYVKKVDMSECLVRFENSHLNSGMLSPAGEGDGQSRLNHTGEQLEEGTLVERKVNGTVTSVGGGGREEHQIPPRTNSQDSMDSNLTLQEDSQSSNMSLPSQNDVNQLHRSLGLEQGQSRKEGGLDIPETSHNSIDAYSPRMGSPEPLPDISVSEAESLLGVSPSPYTQVAGAPSTPSGPQSVASPSYPPGYPPSNSQDWLGTGFPRDMNEMGPMGSGTPPAYPPSYPMDASGYRPPSHPSPMHPGYSPYGIPPSRPEFPPEFQHKIPSHMMRVPYAGGAPPYPGMPPSMPPMGGPRPMDSVPYSSHFHSPMMPPGVYPQSHMMRRMDDMPYPGGQGMPPEWVWQQQLRNPRFPSPLPHHMQSPSFPRHMSHYPGSSSPRLPSAQAQQQAAAMAMQRSGSPGHAPHSVPPPIDGVKIHWQDRMKSASAAAAASAKALERSSPKPSLVKPEKGQRNMSMQSKSSEHHHPGLEGSKRPVPDWSGCVEGTRPKLVKRRRLFSGDCGHVEPWRMMMSLKSGILAESTWALDTLNILLHDDRTVGFFYLKHHQNLLNTLVEHLRVTLVAIFGEDFNILSKYVPGYEGVDLEKGEMARCGNSGKIPSVATYDHKELNLLRRKSSSNGTKCNGNGNHNGSSQVSQSDTQQKGLVPMASVYECPFIKLGKSNDLSHIQVQAADEKLFFPESRGSPEILSEAERQELEKCSRIQRIDETPVSELQQREELLNRIPIHRFGRLSRSPRRRERSFLEDMKLREKEKEEKAKVLEEEGRKDEFVVPSGPLKSGEKGSKSPDIVKEEDEIHREEALPLWSVPPSKELLKGRCLCISNILRSLSFIPGNDLEFSQHPGVLIILGHILMLHHNHLIRKKRPRPSIIKVPKQPPEENSEKEKEKEKEREGEEEEMTVSIEKTAEQTYPVATDYWWWNCLEVLRENVLVILSNISGQLDLSIFPESISYPIMSGLLHWAVCPSAHAIDALPDSAKVTSLSPQRLVLETLAKISISEANVDFILATPPLMRQDRLFSQLVQFISQKRHPVVRQFALVLLSNLAQGSEAVSRLIGQQKMVVSLLLECLETSEHAASGGQLVGGYNPDDPNSLSIAMLRRAATTLHCLAKVPANRTAFLPYRDRMLYLATSQYVEPSVSSILMDMLFELGKL